MCLNMSKTVAMGIRAGSTQQRRRRPYASAVKVGGETIVTATSAKILGVRTSVESVRASRANDARLSAHDGLIDRLSTSKLPFDVRCEVASSNVLSSVLAGCSYETYTQTRLKGFRTRVVRGAFGSRQPSRSVTAVLSILAKGHRLDPVIARPYRILCSFFDACERLPRVYARMLNIARLYSRHGVLLPEARLGPVGIAISDGFTVAGIGFEGRDFATAALEGRRLLDMERGERHHAIRARLRQTTWTQLARQRPSYDGVQAGVDCRRTNELRLATADAGEKRALAVILSGGVFLAARWGRNARANGGAAGSDGSPSSSASVSSTASDTTGSFDEHASESSSSEPQRPPLDRGCRDCDRGVQDTADHLWWECPAYDEIRGRPCFAELLRADRARWPPCTRVHGVIVEGMRVEVAALHRLMAAVYTARVEAERRRLSAVQPMHPWHAAAPLPAVQHLFNFDRLPDEPPRWPYGGRAMRALKGWLSALRWTNAGEVSCVELAVDFEVHTGVDVPAPPGIRRLAANQRGKTLWTMLSTLCRLCRDLQLPSPLPAERKVRVGSMRTLGAPMLWGGLTPRPRFAGGEETHGVLEASFPRAAAGDGKNWGGDVFPQYDAARRAQRSLRWDVPTPLPQRPRLPVLVPAAQADPLLRTQSVCDACAKQKCAVCTGMRRNYSLVVDQCCQVHHRPDDGLRIQCCRAHRLTRCGTCPNADACCGRGHHRGGAGRDSSSGDGGGGGHGGRGRGRGRGGRGGGDDSGGDGGGGRGTGRGRARGGARGGGRGGGGGGGRGESDGLTGRKRRAPSPPGTPTSHDEKLYEVFRRAFEGFIPRRQMDLRDVTGRELRDVLNKRKKKTTACGVDGWRLDELKALPDELLDGFATLFNLVEERGEWPKGMLTSLVSLIPKTDDTSPTNLRPITVTSCVYRLWACRRLQDVMEWQDGWILPSQHGFRRGHRTDDVLMELTTLIEETLLDESKSLYMVALDFAKCFDRVPQGIVLRLAEGMGLDARILRPLRAMYRGMKRRFKLPLGVGSEFEVTNGILQGCPLSVILINALLSIVLRAVSARVPEVSSESLADDATLFASVESELQQAVDVIAQFCALTGMRLNMTKTLAMGIPAGTVRQRRRRPYTSVLAVGDETIPTATAAKILGVRTSVASVQAERTNDARLKAHNALLDRLSTSRLPFDVRCEVASSNVLGSVLAGCSYEGYTQTCLRGLRSRVVKGAFGTKHPSRNVTAVLAILAKAHRMDPLLARPYRILCSLFDTCERLPRVHARMLNIARLYSRHGVLLPKARLGPVGIAISDGFTVAGIDFEGHDFATAALEGRRLLDMERGERHHAIRARLRQTTWTQLARQRPSYDGVQAGVDCRRTNELRLATADAGEKRALAVILSGGVFLAARWGRNARANGGAAGTDGSPSSSASVSSTASDTTGSFDEHVSESSSSEPQRPPLDRGCRDCDLGVQDTADHLWWECPAYDEIRGRPCFAELLRADRARWPSCTRVHGVIVEGMRVEVAALHRLMAAVYTARVEAERRRLSAVQPMHPWHAAAPLPAVQHLFDFDRLPDEPPRWPYGGRAMRALKGWLSALRWTNAGEVSCVELAVDFEVHTGVDVPAPPGIRRLAANQRGKTLWTMLSTLCRLCQDLQLPSPLPAERKVRVGSMRTLGAPMLWGGLTPRPRFAGGEETHGVLGTSFPRAAAGDGKNWGGDVFPQYDAARRAQRSLRWDVPTPLPQRPRLPVLVPAAQADPLLRTQSVCDACAKQKCAVCTGMRRNYSLVVDQCCQVHHRPDDGLRIQCCRAHRLTRWVVLAATAAVATGVAVVMAAAAVAAAAAAEAAETTVTETVAAAAALVAAAHAAAVAAAVAAGIAAAAAVAVAA
ncbi:Retrovirus-related Pol polyprotein from type-1 retrotransposable element R2 [Diplonema papillatum]|nr:Retrovirus-related Pol polyprotein from type-1 retrotransposable element R2 [Diplonema papillatum]